ncbi:hypothetical protein [Micropruina sp.]|uniref:hypothetical protein n=1 Tax=Micropruina sp. TaxID=2737536 RepID=UPI0039E248ED
MTALEAPRRTSEQRPRRWGLTQVPIPDRRMASVPFVLVLGVFLGLGMVGLLLLNTALQEQGFAVQAQQKQATQLGYRVAALESEVTEARSSTRLAIEATKLGMVPNPYPVYLALPAGTVIGDPSTISGYEVPDVRYRTPAELAAMAKRAADAEAKRVAELKAAAEKRAEEKQKAEAAEKKAEEKQKAEAAKKKAEEKEKAEAAKKKAEQQAADKKKGTDR